VLSAFAQSGATAVMLARGSLGNPWLFASLLGQSREPSPQEVCKELRWLAERAVEHLGTQRATRWLRKAYPWYVARLPLRGAAAKQLQSELQRASGLSEAEQLLARRIGAVLEGDTPRYTPALAAA
jgi:tRNA-dihydrouridine synthase B